MKRVVFWGATGQAKVLRDAMQGAEPDAALVALFDNRVLPSPFPDVECHHGVDGFEAWVAGRDDVATLRYCVAVGGDKGGDRLSIMEFLDSRGLQPLTIVHPRAFVAADAALGRGCQVLAMAAVCAGARLGNGTIINTGASVDHDCVIGDGVHIAPGATLAGEVVVEDRAFVGSGAVVLPGLRIGSGATVGAGAVVTRSVASGATVVGNPARARIEHKGDRK